MALIARAAYDGGTAGSVVPVIPPHDAQAGAPATYAAGMGGTTGARRAGAEGFGWYSTPLGERSQVVHSWYWTPDGGTTTAGNAVISSVRSAAGAELAQVTRRSTGRLALREGSVLRAETSSALAAGTYRLVHTISGATQQLTVRRAADDSVVETITAPMPEGGFSTSVDGFVNNPGGTLTAVWDEHLWDDAGDPGPFGAQGGGGGGGQEPTPGLEAWAVVVGGVERPATSVAVLVGGVERPLTAHEVVGH